MTNVEIEAKTSRSGVTLIEMLISLALISLLLLSFSNFVIKGNVISTSLNMRFTETSEIQMLLMDIQKDLKQGASISDNSHNKRLEYTTYNLTGATINKIYRITTIRSYAAAS
jgi:prepilin-type N-terminal cleavage/methylation domain-containing protein